jgi:outer membrane receptor protein involved in Fe transport
VAAVFGAATILLWSSVSLAAEQAKEVEEDEELEEVQVTGTRIQSPNVTAANPVTSISGEEMRRLGIVNVSDALTQLVPQNISTYMPTMVGDEGNTGTGGASTIDRGSTFIGNTIANLRGLDPQYGSRTLTLIDGKRVASTSNQADVVDLNIIPSNLLERMDVVTGGASATYGSGAMAGVVNLVLARRLTGINVDMDYGVNEVGDGGSPHISLSGGTPLFEGRGHVLFGAEWQNQSAIRDCAAARSWCAESRTLFNNTTAINNGSAAFYRGAVVATPGFEGFPGRFEMQNYRYSQFKPEGTIYFATAAAGSDYLFTDEADGTKGVKEYALGFRGGLTSNGVVNGDGPLTTTGQTVTPSNERKTFFTNFEFDINSTTTAYLQGRYATTDADNKNRYTRQDSCVRFDSQGVAFIPGASVTAGQFLTGATSAALTEWAPGTPTGPAITPNYPARHPAYGIANFRAFMGISSPSGTVTFNAPGGAPGAAGAVPYWITPTLAGFNYGTTPNGTTPPDITFQNGTPQWRHVESTGTEYWILVGITLTADFSDPGTPATLPGLGRNAYAFLNQLNPEALALVRNAFGTAGSTFGALANPETGAALGGFGATVGGNGAGSALLWGGTPCAGFTAVRKVWSPQVQQFTTQSSDTWGATAGVRGRFGADWRWDASYQYGSTKSASRQNNVQTNVSSAFAMDAVIDDRPIVNGQANPTYGQPVCRIVRDGIPPLDWEGRPLSDPEGFAQLAEGCKPLNVFGTTASAFNAGFGNPLTADQAALLQAQALDYAFRNSASDGKSSLQTIDISTNGTLWQGWAGPLTGAFGLQLNENTIDNKGTRGPLYLRGDIARAWGDAFGGTTRSAEAYTELNMPLVVGQPGIELLSVNAALRWGFYNNKGGAGTAVDADGKHLSSTQDTPNWKFATEFSPFDWVRFRLTRSRDLRAAGYRELFIYQPTVADSVSGQNPWRERTADSNENQFERYGTINVGNPELKPEKSDTLTLGLVLRPGGWAQGMSASFDYYSISVKDGIAVAFGQAQPINACWRNSGNVPQFVNGEENPEWEVNHGRLNLGLVECQGIVFADLLDENGDPILDSNGRNVPDIGDIQSYRTGAPSNALPYKRRGLDFSLSYNFPLSRAFESLPGSVSLSVRGTRALESSGSQNVCTVVNVALLSNCNTGVNAINTVTTVDVVGQIRNPGNGFIPGVSPTPKWTGNVSATYLLGNLTTTLSARYIGGAVLDKAWIDDPEDPAYWARDAAGNFLLDSSGNRQLSNASVDRNTMAPYVNFALNGSYNLQVADLKQFQVFGSINNLFDKSPPFNGGGISGATAQFNDTLGRAFRMGVRMKF